MRGAKEISERVQSAKQASRKASRNKNKDSL
jgi:hypothetical protein